MIYTLFIWTVVGFAGTNISTYERRDWRALEQFETLERCEAAAKELALNSDRYRCVRKK